MKIHLPVLAQSTEDLFLSDYRKSIRPSPLEIVALALKCEHLLLTSVSTSGFVDMTYHCFNGYSIEYVYKIYFPKKSF